MQKHFMEWFFKHRCIIKTLLLFAIFIAVIVIIKFFPFTNLDDYPLIGDLHFPKQDSKWYQKIKTTSADIEISELFENLTFEDVDGGVWKQGFDITYDERQWTKENKLNVFIVPHSHNDPGWLLTFEEYFEQRTKNILDTVVNSLSEKSSRRFIWAETSYLSLWWKQASEEMKAKMKRLILETKQLEIVTGGWVMTDEANSHYYAMIEQMIEGHEWLRANIGKSVEPRYGWSIDPFGYTPTMAYLLKQMGFEGMLIQRVHYHLKKYMALNKRLEFMWKQSWSTSNSKDTSIFCHVMPFHSYDISHTCGPDPNICCQFDFKRDNDFPCPWGIPPETISQLNVESRAEMLLDQYRKKAQLYGDQNNHNFVLIPLGDDFRYQSMQEARDQFENYERLIEYMNSRSDWNVNARFGTLSEYFEALNEHNRNNNKKVETFSGDFFTYADRNDHYWSGYFTSRIFTKRLDRIVENYLRCAEILFSISNLIQEKFENKFTKANELFKHLLTARRNLGLFQHHDGITGTAKIAVVQNYIDKLYQALNSSKTIIEQSMTYLATKQQINTDNVFDIDDVQLHRNDFTNVNDPYDNIRSNSNSNSILIEFKSQQSERKIVLFNGNLNRRDDVVSFRVNEANVEVIDESTGVKINNIQVSLVWPNTEGGYLSDFDDLFDSNNEIIPCVHKFSDQVFELLFEVNLNGLSTKTYVIRKVNNKKRHFSGQVTFHLRNISAELIGQHFKTIDKRLKSKGLDGKINLKSESSNDENMIKVEASEQFTALFSSKSGLLQKLVSNTDGRELKTKVKFIKYGTASSAELSGAYLFHPDGPAKSIDASTFRWIRVESGNLLRNRVCVQTSVVLHCVEFYPTVSRAKQLKLPYLSVWNVVDLRKEFNYELAMHIETDVNNEDTIHTDLNGFQYVKRKRYEKLTLQGNVFPMPTGAFIQDSRMRFSVLGAQPTGVASLENSCLQVFIDRRLDQDDNRGLEQPMNDNVLASSRFVLFYESLNQQAFDSQQSKLDFPSIMSQIFSNELLNPPLKLVLKNIKTELVTSRQFVTKQAPCDLHLVNMRSLQNDREEPVKNEAALIMHRFALDDCCLSLIKNSAYVQNECLKKEDNFTFEDLFVFLDEPSMHKMTVRKAHLSLSVDTKPDQNEIKIKKSDNLKTYLQPMQIEAFRTILNL